MHDKTRKRCMEWLCKSCQGIFNWVGRKQVVNIVPDMWTAFENHVGSENERQVLLVV